MKYKWLRQKEIRELVTFASEAQINKFYYLGLIIYNNKEINQDMTNKIKLVKMTKCFKNIR